MTGADRAIRYSAIGAVSVVALVAAFVSTGAGPVSAYRALRRRKRRR